MFMLSNYLYKKGLTMLKVTIDGYPTKNFFRCKEKDAISFICKNLYSECSRERVAYIKEKLISGNKFSIGGVEIKTVGFYYQHNKEFAIFSEFENAVVAEFDKFEELNYVIDSLRFNHIGYQKIMLIQNQLPHDYHLGGYVYRYRNLVRKAKELGIKSVRFTQYKKYKFTFISRVVNAHLKTKGVTTFPVFEDGGLKGRIL